MSSYLVKIKGNYYFRIRIPQDVVHHFPSPEIKRSLRTKNPKNAKSHARLWSSKVEQVFLTLRADLVASEQVKDYIHRSLPSIWKDCKKVNVVTAVSQEKKDLQVKGKQLKEVIEAYLKECIALGKWSEKTAYDNRKKLFFLMKLIGNIPIKQIDRKMMLGYLETLKRLPAGCVLVQRE